MSLGCGGSVKRLEAKLDRMAAAVGALSSGKHGPAPSQHKPVSKSRVGTGNSDQEAATGFDHDGSVRRLEAKLDSLSAVVSALSRGGGRLGQAGSRTSCQHPPTYTTCLAPEAAAEADFAEPIAADASEVLYSDTAVEGAAWQQHRGLASSPDSRGKNANKQDKHDRDGCIDAVQAITVPVETESLSTKMQLEGLDRTLALVAGALGVRDSNVEGGSGDDRRRLKEKLKAAMESGQRLSVRHIDSEREMWVEYVFGICKPDGRVGKGGSK